MYFPEPDIDPSVMDDVYSFLEDCAEYNCDLSDWHKLKSITISQELNKDKDTLAGVCMYDPYTRDIILDPDSYQPGNCRSKSLAYHELAHCVLNLDHVESNQFEIMNPAMPTEYDCITNWEAAADRFFKSALDKAQSK